MLNRHLNIYVWQFGGVGSIHLDYDLAPFVKLSFYKHYIDGLRYLIKECDSVLEVKMSVLKKIMPSIDDEAYFETNSEAYFYAMDMLDREGKQSTEALYHNLNTLESRQGSQVNKVA